MTNRAEEVLSREQEGNTALADHFLNLSEGVSEENFERGKLEGLERTNVSSLYG